MFSREKKGMVHERFAIGFAASLDRKGFKSDRSALKSPETKH